MGRFLFASDWLRNTCDNFSQISFLSLHHCSIYLPTRLHKIDIITYDLARIYVEGKFKTPFIRLCNEENNNVKLELPADFYMMEQIVPSERYVQQYEYHLALHATNISVCLL